MIRDLLDELAHRPAPDPVAAARKGMRPPPRKRFYKEVSVGEEAGGHAVLLDGKRAKTPARHPLVLPTRALAAAVAAEWAAQEAVIDPARMPLTRLANLAIDRVTDESGEVADEIVRYAGSDLVLYRAPQPAALTARQSLIWDPIVAWARERLGAHFVVTAGVIFVAQPEATVAAVRAEIERYAPPFKLAALASLTALAGSALIALACAQGALDADAAWAAAHVDEDWNMRQWGADAEASGRHAARKAEFDAAVRLLALL
jgi:chaperone required for assembly of F1-ATPase